jgi:hypothetical protein
MGEISLIYYGFLAVIANDHFSDTLVKGPWGGLK